MYIRRYGSVSLHIGVGRIRRDFGNCAPYWGWQVIAHEIAHLVGVGGNHYLRHGNVHLSVAKALLLDSLPTSVAGPAIYYLLIDYSLGRCKRGYSRVSMNFVTKELGRVVSDFMIYEEYYLNCSRRLRSIIKVCDGYGRSTNVH